MFGINFSEWLLIAVVGFVVIGPKELPVVIRHLALFIREIRILTSGIRSQFHDLAREAGLDDVMQEMNEMRHGRTIIDLEGKPQKAYNVKELSILEAPKSDSDTEEPHLLPGPAYPRADNE